MVSEGHPHGINSEHWSLQEIKCQVNGPENQDLISMQIYLNEQDGDKGSANAKHIRKSHKLEMKRIFKACSRCDLELGKICPPLHVTPIRPRPRLAVSHFRERAEAEAELPLNRGTFLLPPRGRWLAFNDTATSHSSPAYDINPGSENPIK